MPHTDRTANRELLRRELILDLIEAGTERVEAERVAGHTLELLGKLASRIDVAAVLAAALPSNPQERREDHYADVLRRDQAVLERNVEEGVMTREQADSALDVLQTTLRQATDTLNARDTD